MSKLLLFYGSVLLIYIHFITPIISKNCIHDEVALSNVSIGEMTYLQMRGKRDKHEETFQHFSMHYYIDEVDPKIPESVVLNIETALKKVSSFLHETLAVRRSFNPFLIERANCAKKWQSGINKNKCSSLKSEPEFCSVKLTDYIIPDRYLHKLEIFDFANPVPRQVLNAGQGVENANFFLFVISRTNSWCTENDVQAYSSFCRLDSRNRPVAGLLNMCPSYFSKKIYKSSHYYSVIMHEVIHILGFSRQLYSKFKTCTSIYDCEIPKNIVQVDSNDIQRLVFPGLVKSMQNHFNCSEEEFGGPLDNFQGKDDTSTEMKYSSHWHPLLMYTSIMTSYIAEGDYAIIDNITLALLASTGWYHVNFSKAEHFHFGKGEGCKFGFKKNCEDSKHLCTPSKESQNCDVMRYAIGKCTSIVPYHPCGVYKPNYEKSCLDEFNMPVKEYNQHCVMVTVNMTTEPKCLLTKCRSIKDMEFLINSTWGKCKVNEMAKINDVTLNCPEEGAICYEKEKYANRTFCSMHSDRAISIRMHFSDQTYESLLDNNRVRDFKVSILQSIAENLQISVQHIVNATLTIFKGAFLDFTVCPPPSIDEDEFGNLIDKTQQFLMTGSFTHIFKGATEFPVASSSIVIEPEVAVSFSDYEGFRMLQVIPIICGIFVVASFIASVVRLLMSQKQRPKRESVELEDFSQSNFAQNSNQKLTV